MTHERDIEGLLDRWLSDGPSEAPDRILATMADRIERQPQRPAWRLDWRLTNMHLSIKVGVGIAAVLVIAVIGYQLLPGSVPGGGANATPTPTPEPSPQASPSLEASPSAADWWYDDKCGSCAGVLAAGSHTSASWQPPLTYTVPAGWVNNYDHVDGYTLLPVTAANQTLFGAGGQIFYYLVLMKNERLAASDCSNKPQAGAGFTAAQVVSGLTSRPGLDVTTAAPVTVGGLSGLQLDVAVARDWRTTCPDSAGLPAVPTFQGGDSYRWAVVGERKRIIVLDDPHGGNIVIEVGAPTDGFADHTAALSPIIQSFVFAVGS
jgi:hypothetical protein